MKKFFSLVLLVSISLIGTAQRQTAPPTYNNNFNESTNYTNGFKKENLFIGGGINLGFGSYSFNIGATPEIGYSLTKWLDAGAVLNINYLSQTDSYGTKYKNFNYGTGLFARAWVLPFLYIQAQPEINWVKRNFDNYGNIIPRTTLQSNSLLVGIGYGTRLIGSHYSYLTLMVDLMNDPNSPYRDAYGDAYPIFRAGFGLYLHPSRK